jgi:hypothetical protein
MSRMVFAPFGMLALLILLGLLVAGAVLLVVLLRKKGLLWLLGIAAAIVGVLVVGAIFFAIPLVAYRTMEREETLTATARDRGVAVVATDRSAAEPLDTSAFLADVYPSAAQAVRAVAAQLARSVPTVHEGPALPVVRVRGRAPRELLEQAAEAFRGSSLARSVEVSPDVPGGVDRLEVPRLASRGEEVLCGVRVDSGKEGGVQLVLSGPAGQVTRTARFVEKPWAANFARYVSESSASHILAQSRWLGSSFAEAERAARDDAAGQLMAPVRQSIDRDIAAGRFRPADRPSDGELRRLIGAQLRRGHLVTERFTQRFRRPYGDVWRQSLLVDSSPKRVDQLAAGIAAQTAGERTAAMSSWARIGLSIGALALLIFVVYLVLNAATKGYYVWVLRAAATALVVAGIAAVLLLV